MHSPCCLTLLLSLLPICTLASSLETAKDLPSGWQYLGCFQDNETAGDRLLPRINISSYQADEQMTGSKCLDFCSTFNATIVGLEYGIECFCARNFSTVPPPKADKDQCSMPCSGDASQACGGDYKLTIYYNKSADVQGGATRIASDGLLLLALVMGTIIL